MAIITLFIICIITTLTIPATCQMQTYKDLMPQVMHDCCDQLKVDKCPLEMISNDRTDNALIAIANKYIVKSAIEGPDFTPLIKNQASNYLAMDSKLLPPPTDLNKVKFVGFTIMHNDQSANGRKDKNLFLKASNGKLYRYNKIDAASWGTNIKQPFTCDNVHKVFCQSSPDDLVGVGVFSEIKPSYRTPDKYHVVGYTRSKSDPTKYRADIFYNESQVLSKTIIGKMPSKFTSLTTIKRHSDTELERVLVANGHGFVCEHFRDRKSTTNFFFSHQPDAPRMGECFESNTYLGCPQTFCHSNTMDAIDWMPDGNLRIFRAQYTWDVTVTTGFPLDVPLIENARFDKMSKGYSAMASTPFDVEDDKLFTIFRFHGDANVNLFRFEKENSRWRDHGSVAINTHFPGVSNGVTRVFVDAAWYNPKNKKFYLITDRIVRIMEIGVKNGPEVRSWKKVASDSIEKVFPGIKWNIDAIFSDDTNVYAFKNQFMFTAKLSEFETGGKLKGTFLVSKVAGDRKKKTGFFDYAGDPCKYSDADLKALHERADVYGSYLIPYLGKPPPPTTTTTEDPATNTTIDPINPSKPGITPTINPSGAPNTNSTNDKGSTPKSDKKATVIVTGVVIGVLVLLVLIVGGIVYMVKGDKKPKINRIRVAD